MESLFNNCSKRKIYFFAFATIAIISLLPFLFTICSGFALSSEEGANVGAAISGIVGPVVALLAAFMAFCAFWVQCKTYARQCEDIVRERLTGQFMKLMDIYRDTLHNINLENKIHGQPAFHFIFYEFKSIYAAVCDKSGKMIALKDVDLLYISFEIFMSGIVRKKNPILNNRIINRLRKEKYTITDGFRDDLDKLERRLVDANCDLRKKGEPPRCFRKEKYPKDMNFPNLYKGYMDKLTSYFNTIDLILLFLQRHRVERRTDVEFFEQMFASQLNLHEVSLIVIYLEYVRYRDKRQENMSESLDFSFLEKLNKRFPKTFYWRDPNFLNSAN